MRWWLFVALLAGCPERSQPRLGPPTGSPEPIVEGLVSPVSLAVAGDSVIYADYADRGVSRVAKTGGPVVAFPLSQNSIAATTDGEYVYWGDRGSDGVVRRFDVLGLGMLEPLGTAPTDAAAVAVDGDDLYVGIDPVCIGPGSCGALQDLVVRLPKSGGATTSLYTVIQGEGHRVWDLAVDDDTVYWVEDYAIMKVSRAGGAPVTLATPGMGQTLHVALAAGFVYAATGDAVLRVPAGGGAVEVVVSGEPDVRDVAADEAGVYWLTPAALRFANHEGGPPVTLADVIGGLSVAADASGVYFSTARPQPVVDAGALADFTPGAIWALRR